MGYNRRDEDWQADRFRDERKHDRLPSRLSPPLSTAMDIALCVRGMDNLNAAAALIEQYADTKAAADRLDAVAAGARP